MAVPRFHVTERQVLLLLLATSFVGFGGVFLLGGFRPHGTRIEQVNQAKVRWMPPRGMTAAAPSAYVFADYFDPSLLSLPSEHGFSQSMWHRSATAPPRTFDATPELALLDPPAATDMVPLLVQSALSDAVRSSVEKLPAAVEDTGTNEMFDVATAATQSTLRVEDALEDRNLLQQPELPVAAGETGLKPTRVRVAVATDGRVQYAVLDRSCGNETIDAQAVEIARQLRFEPVTSSDPLALVWGAVRFFWTTK